jgi:hypothetical protein
VRPSATASGQLLTWRTVDGQAEEIARLAQISVPIAMRDEVDESEQVEHKDCEENEEKRSLIYGGATGSILLGFYGSFEVLRLAARFDDVVRRRVVLNVLALCRHK